MLEETDMDVASVAKPGANGQVPLRPDAAPATTTVKTEAPAHQAVAAIKETAEVNLQISSNAELLRRSEEIFAAAAGERRVDRDDASHLLIYKTIDGDTGEVVRQYPDEVQVKLRQYARELEREQAEAAEARHVERSA